MSGAKTPTSELGPQGLRARDRSWHPDAYTPGYKTSVLRSPQKALISFDSTLSELTGPAFGQNALGAQDDDLILNFAKPGEAALGPRIVVYGRVQDEDGRGVPNTLVEVWQANASGRYRHKREGYKAPLDPNFAGFGRTVSDDQGMYEFRTILPGPYPWPNGPNDWRPSHIHISVFGSGFGQRLITQMYFEGDPLIRLCPIVNTITDPAAIDQLTAKMDIGRTLPMDARAYRFDITLRGRRQSRFENKW